MYYLNVSIVSNKDGLNSSTSQKRFIIKRLLPDCSFSNFCYSFFNADPVMQSLHQKQHNS